MTTSSRALRLSCVLAAASALAVTACKKPPPSALEQASETLQDHPLPEKPPPPPAVGPAPPTADSAPATRPVAATPPAHGASSAASRATEPAAAEKPAAAPAEPAAPAVAEAGAGPWESELVRYDGENIWLTGKVEFDSSHRFIKQSSRPVLDDVARLLEQRPEIARVEIQGHRHSRIETGGEKITQTRAEAVRDYLIDRGVHKARLTAVGYGAQVPVDTNRTEAGRAANTRIELIILEHAK